MTEAATDILRVRNLCKSYRSGDTRLDVLRGVDFDLAAGEFVSVVGQSGSGKSTLLHLMGLLDAADAGEVVLAGTRIAGLSAARRDRLRNTCVGMVFQSYYLLPELDALENVMAPLMVRHGIFEWLTVRSAVRARARELLDRFVFFWLPAFTLMNGFVSIEPQSFAYSKNWRARFTSRATVARAYFFKSHSR